MADIVLECRRTYRFLTGFQALPVQLNRFRGSFRRLLGKQNVGIGAKWGPAQGLLRQGDPLPLGRTAAIAVVYVAIFGSLTLGGWVLTPRIGVQFPLSERSAFFANSPSLFNCSAFHFQ